MYMRDNISYDYKLLDRTKKGPAYVWYPAKATFQTKKAICSGHAAFALYCLLNNGYNYNNFDAHKHDAACVLSATGKLEAGYVQGHSVCMYVENGDFYSIDIRHGNRIVGPCKTIEEVAQNTIGVWRDYKFRDVNGKRTKTVYR